MAWLKKSAKVGRAKAFKSFLRDRAGNTAMLFGLAIVPFVTVAAASIDVGRLEGMRFRLQAATDAAALAAARSNLVNAAKPQGARRAAAEADGRALFAAALEREGLTPEQGEITFTYDADEEIVATGTARAPLAFAGWFGFEEVNLQAVGAAQVADLRIVEVALVLDNTASMFDQNRFSTMRGAVVDFVDKMFDESPAPELTKIGVVPWSTTVNINSEAVATADPSPHASANPPAAGDRSLPRPAVRNRLANLSHPDTGRALTQAEQDAMFAPVEWRGCIRAAPGEVQVSNTGAVTRAATDAAPAGMRWPAAWVKPELSNRNGKLRNCTKCPRPPRQSRPRNPSPPTSPPPPPPPPRGPQGFLDLPGASFPRYASLDDAGRWLAEARQAARPIAVCQNERPVETGDVTPGGQPVLSCGRFNTGVLDCRQNDGRGLRNAYVPERQVCTRNGRTYNQRLEACVSDPNEFRYIRAGGRQCSWRTDNTPWTSNQPVLGPNLNCPTAMLPLSGNRRQVIDKLDHMYPVPGGTQADVGLRWGLRVLSDRTQWRSFFGHSAATAPGPFNGPTHRKIAILLTDGENVAPIDFEGYYGCTENNRGAAGRCWRAPDVRRLDDATLDRMTLNVCEAMRNDYGVELYTIAVDVPEGRGTQLLRDCAGDPERAFVISTTELGVTFQAIAERELRLTR